jgi:glycosyltransferase involved in cell wall biosynthesis
LYIASAPPVPSKIGPSRRNFHIIEQLARFYDVTVLALGSPTDAARFHDVFGSRISAAHFASSRRSSLRRMAWKVGRTAIGRCDFAAAEDPDLRDLCVRVTRKHSFEAIVLSSALLHTLPFPPGVPVVGDTHNVEFDLLQRVAATSDSWARRSYARRQSQATRDEERRAAHRVALLLATSERDRTVFERELDAPRVDVVSNGIDLDEFRPVSRPGEPGVILFTGLMSYYPNQQAIRWFLDHVFPIVLRRVRDARLVVAGASPPRWLSARADDRLRVTGAVPDMRPFLGEARVTIAPLLSGGGTRVKILEAQAVGRPVVSTTVGAEGLAVRDGESILLADDPETFARHVVAVLTDDVLAARLAAAARRHVVSTHDWDCIGEQLANLLRTRVGLTPNAGATAQEPIPVAGHVAH